MNNVLALQGTSGCSGEAIIAEATCAPREEAHEADTEVTEVSSPEDSDSAETSREYTCIFCQKKAKNTLAASNNCRHVLPQTALTHYSLLPRNRR